LTTRSGKKAARDTTRRGTESYRRVSSHVRAQLAVAYYIGPMPRASDAPLLRGPVDPDADAAAAGAAAEISAEGLASDSRGPRATS
jgi:hypothetical protein